VSLPILLSGRGLRGLILLLSSSQSKGRGRKRLILFACAASVPWRLPVAQRLAPSRSTPWQCERAARSIARRKVPARPVACPGRSSARPIAGQAPTLPRRRRPAPVAGGATFPKAVSPKYAEESAGRARMHTCLDQYNANKATNANGGFSWIAKGRRLLTASATNGQGLKRKALLPSRARSGERRLPFMGLLLAPARTRAPELAPEAMSLRAARYCCGWRSGRARPMRRG
jgi:hypothetical protein